MSKINLMSVPLPLLEALVGATEILATDRAVTILSTFYEREMRKVFPETFVAELAKKAGDHLLSSFVVEAHPEFEYAQVSEIVSQVIEEVTTAKGEGHNG